MPRAPEIDTYKGWPIITVWTGRIRHGEEEKIILGFHKAAAVCDQIDHIRDFVDRAQGFNPLCKTTKGGTS